jgi:hypothetical protein
MSSALDVARRVNAGAFASPQASGAALARVKTAGALAEAGLWSPS